MTLKLKALAACLAFATGSATLAETSWTGYTYLASDALPGSSNLIALAQEFSERSEGDVTLTVNLAGSLGIKAADITQSVGTGIIDIAADGFFLGSVEEGGILRLPMLFASLEEFNAGLEVVTPALEEAFAEQGVVLLAQYLYPLQVGWGTFDMASLDDMKGRKMRVSSPEQGAFVEAFGGAPITIGGAEVPTALQTGVVDGVFTASVGGGRLWKDQLTSTYRLGPNFFNSAIIVNKVAFDALTEADQALLRELAQKYAGLATEQNMANEASVTSDLKAGGIAVHEVSDGDIDKAQKAMAPFWDQWATGRNTRTQRALADVRAELGR
ncbi:TRAP transporter substrate-binding protein [Stappia sp.]|uniref:TRAP transporter substrate-binding protein n=1 Tax=Stappia sp. TaxID=1870903 RepID=UPI003A996130